ncbi:uncharacterized protein L969DRAFT_92722 [Mixia osmundae IAM 14324]|uniref:Uncharacterized protein n=1 Tax=Mixia osmundae (strain CBS 9802 / IAM 14324 / JCM 22182 / KY 12970) TaxID=764103 RepID=G7DYD0_MIXOS|nr:uncharacterized protein L969DRAFT_92722 [Mixia osmundae IAM 14324]KEI41493.1 hypothetical protein L969DRAFT_92722 [Mixia osmundae IAM 14324]GAA95590.1 hypothetical protein E5Q_02246 [Mixia osmundae IAM 14324]
MAGIINGILGGLGNAACSLLNSCESSSSTDSEPASTSAAAASTKAADSVADNTRVVATFVTVAPFTASTSPARATSSAIAAAVASSASPSLSVRSQTTQTSPIATAATTATTSPSALTTSTPEAIASTFVTSRVILASQSASQTATVATESSDGSSSSTDSTSSSVSSSSVSTSSAADSTPRGAIDADLVLLGLFAFLLLAALVVSRRRVQQSKARALALQRTPSVEPYRLSDLKEDDQYSSDSECDMSIRASTAMGYAKLDLASLPRAQRVSTLPYLSSQSSQRSSTVDPLVVRQRLYEALPEPPISQADHQLGTAGPSSTQRELFCLQSLRHSQASLGEHGNEKDDDDALKYGHQVELSCAIDESTQSALAALALTTEGDLAARAEERSDSPAGSPGCSQSVRSSLQGQMTATGAGREMLGRLNVVAIHLSLIALVVSLALYRFLWADADDPYRCEALLNSGSFLDAPASHSNWQPQGCILHNYKVSEVTACLGKRRVLFIGDSTVRQVYYGLAKTLDPEVDTIAEKHSDRQLVLAGVQLDFVWDPFLNGTRTESLLQGMSDELDLSPPTVVVLGSGMWFLRNHGSEQAISLYTATLEKVLDSVKTTNARGRPMTDELVILPVEPVVVEKLRPDRAATIREEDIETMNNLLRVRSDATVSPTGFSIPWSFNDVLAGNEDQTIDGMHYADPVAKLQAKILLNLRCNDVLPKKFPLDKTCCFQYSAPNYVQAFVILLLLGWAPLGMFLLREGNTGHRFEAYFPSASVLVPLSTFGFAIVFIFLGDRTSLFLKEAKQFSALQFAVLNLAALGVGLATMKPAEKDLGFLNRDQTDEWKGWMQIAILIYHYLGASKVSGIYNPIRTLVAAYLFQSGYGHTTFYYKKGDYGLARVMSVVIRLNLLTIALTYAMDTDYLSYYFSPLVTMHFGFIWIIMFVGNQWNKNAYFLLAKIIIGAALAAIYFELGKPLEYTFRAINAVFRTQWIAREWSFRVTLDMYIVFWGMAAALAFIKFQEHKIADRPDWPIFARAGIIVGSLGMLGFMIFELTQNKFDYNVYHPFISIIPVGAFCVLRNATPALRSTSSKFFIFFGHCSLETFIIQFHLWMGADTKGLLMMIPGTQWRIVNFIVASFIFVFISNQVARATGELTSWLMGNTKHEKPAALPTHANGNGAEYIPLAANGEEPTKSEEPMVATESSGIRIMRIISSDLRFRLLAYIVIIWAINILYPSLRPPDGHILVQAVNESSAARYYGTRVQPLVNSMNMAGPDAFCCCCHSHKRE